MYAVFFHAHQKLDKVARQHLGELLAASDAFPSYKDIESFEGQHGPDGTKLKNQPGQIQPWHFYDPLDPADTELVEIIEGHYRELTNALKADNRARAAFEASWLAHALVDGLTPAHHYPYEEELERLRGGLDRHSRKTLTSRLVVKGETRRDSFKRSVALMGPKGLLMNHTTFEGGAYSIIKMMNLRKDSFPSAEAIKHIQKVGLGAYFAERAQYIASLHEYERFMAKGWTPVLAREVRKILIPEMIRTITLAWYTAAKEAGLKVNQP